MAAKTAERQRADGWGLTWRPLIEAAGGAAEVDHRRQRLGGKRSTDSGRHCRGLCDRLSPPPAPDR